MKHNLKNRPVKSTPQRYEEWIKGFEAELREKLKYVDKSENTWYKRAMKDKSDWKEQVSLEWKLLGTQLREILGDSEVA